MAAEAAPDEIRRAAKQLDDAVEEKAVEEVLSCFVDDCVVEFCGVTLLGKDGLRRGLTWLYDQLGTIQFHPVTILVEGNTFFEEFVMRTRKEPGAEFQTRAAEVLVYEGVKVKALRLYVDRLALVPRGRTESAAPGYPGRLGVLTMRVVLRSQPAMQSLVGKPSGSVAP